MTKSKDDIVLINENRFLTKNLSILSIILRESLKRNQKYSEKDGERIEV